MEIVTVFENRSGDKHVSDSDILIEQPTELERLIYNLDLAIKHAVSYRIEFDVPGDQYLGEYDDAIYEARLKIGDYVERHRDKIGITHQAVMILPPGEGVFVCVDWNPNA